MSMLQQLLEDSAQRYPANVAVEDPGRGEDITYRALNELSDKLRDDLLRHGVQASDRVGICARKSIAGLVSIFGILKAGAAYVPVAADAPDPQNACIFSDCSVKALLVDRSILKQLREGSRGHDLGVAQDCAALSPYGDELALVGVHREQNPAVARPGALDNLAYILYTSGSTGTPKGIMHSHSSALSFVDWCSKTFEPAQGDRFSSHAPFHFDLSIFDVYVAVKHGATLVLIGDEVGKQAAHLAALIAEQRVSIWYSTPSVLRLLVEYGRMERHDYSRLRLILFAGEVFPYRHLRALLGQLPNRRYFNLYGPTETNVCTFCEISRECSGDQTGPTSIGRACSGTLTRVMHENGHEVRPGEEGELYVSGATVMLGYWNQPDLDAEAFLVDGEGRRWYKTGDLVKEADTGDYLFLGRRDRMVKRRGFRIELGEVESLLYRHPLVTEVAVIAFADQEDNVQIKAFLCCAEEKPPSLVTLKRFCAENLPSYLIPDQFSFLKAIPKTSTDKIDYQSLMRAH
jgi:amino acid adenylation domain-containing protein